MAKGRPRKPTALKHLQGTSAYNKDRLNPAEPVPSGHLGAPPEALNLPPEAAAMWVYLDSIIAPGVAMNCDQPLIAMASRLLARMNADTITDSQLATLLRCLSQLGMTPADRSRIVAQHNKPSGGRFDKFS